MNIKKLAITAVAYSTLLATFSSTALAWTYVDCGDPWKRKYEFKNSSGVVAKIRCGGHRKRLGAGKSHTVNCYDRHKPAYQIHTGVKWSDWHDLRRGFHQACAHLFSELKGSVFSYSTEKHCHALCESD